MSKNGNGVFTIDGMDLRIHVMELSRGFRVTDTEHSGRAGDYSAHRDIIGTFYNYTLQVDPDPEYRSDYDRFYDIISSPVKSHRLIVPYGQETLEFEAYATSGDDKLTIRTQGVASINRWKGLSINFIAMEPQRRP